MKTNLVSDEPDTVYFQYQNIIHHSYLLAVDELHLSLVAQHIDLQADAFTFIYVPRLGKELNVKRLALYLPRCLRMHVASNLLSAAWVYPLPLFAELTEVLIRLMIFCHNSYLLVDEFIRSHRNHNDHEDHPAPYPLRKEEALLAGIGLG